MWVSLQEMSESAGIFHGVISASYDSLIPHMPKVERQFPRKVLVLRHVVRVCREAVMCVKQWRRSAPARFNLVNGSATKTHYKVTESRVLLRSKRWADGEKEGSSNKDTGKEKVSVFMVNRSPSYYRELLQSSSLVCTSNTDWHLIN